VFGCDLAETTPPIGLPDVDDMTAMALGAAVLTHHPAAKPLRNPEKGAQGLNSSAAPLRAKKFSSANTLSMAFSCSASAKSFLNLVFSFSSHVSRLASSACMPPYSWRRQQWQLD
jgi:hypothetical protein